MKHKPESKYITGCCHIILREVAAMPGSPQVLSGKFEHCSRWFPNKNLQKVPGLGLLAGYSDTQLGKEGWNGQRWSELSTMVTVDVSVTSTQNGLSCWVPSHLFIVLYGAMKRLLRRWSLMSVTGPDRLLESHLL